MVRTGRPRGFDRTKAVEQAMLVFWDHGYEATSLAQLRTAMGNISTASFYSAFGSKHALYEEAVRLYAGTYGKVTAPLHDPALTPRDAVEQTLRRSACMQTDPAHPAGCLLVLSLDTCSPESRELLISARKERDRSRHGFRTVLRRAKERGDLHTSAPSDALATLFDGCLLGLSVQARDNVSCQQLQAAIGALMTVWDGYRPTGLDDQKES